MKSKWLKQSLEKLDKLKQSLSRQPFHAQPQDVYEEAANIAKELGSLAAQAGRADLVELAASMEGCADPDDVRYLIARALEPQPNKAAFYTPPQVAKLLGVKPGKVNEWIDSGELPAVNIAQSKGGRARWRVSAEAFDLFQRKRMKTPPTPVRRKRRASDVKQFV